MTKDHAKKLLFAGALAGSGTAAFAAETGGVYACPGVAPAPDVGIWVGRIDEEQHARVVSVVIWPLDGFDGQTIGHAPFDEKALADCQPGQILADNIDKEQFDEGYAIWREAFDSSKAGVWQLSPSAAYSAILGMLDQ